MSDTEKKDIYIHLCFTFIGER